MKRRVGIGMVAGTLWGLSLAFGCAQTIQKPLPQSICPFRSNRKVRNPMLGSPLMAI